MLESIKQFLEDNSKEVSQKLDQVRHNKFKLFEDRLFEFTRFADALLDRNQNHSFKKALDFLAKDAEVYPYPEKDYSEDAVSILDDEQAAIEVYKQLLTEDYKAPSDLAKLQQHLKALWFYYGVIEPAVFIPAISNKIDYAAMRIAEGVAFAMWKTSEKGTKQDHGKSISRGKFWMRKKFLPIAKEMLQKMRSEDPGISNSKAANKIWAELGKKRTDAPANPRAVYNWLFKKKRKKKLSLTYLNKSDIPK